VFDLVRLALALNVIAAVLMLKTAMHLMSAPDRSLCRFASFVVVGVIQMYFAIWIFEIWRWGM